jgi:hypothetical protein
MQKPSTDATAILITYQDGLLASELALRWDNIDFQSGKLHVRCEAKRGMARSVTAVPAEYPNRARFHDLM